MKFDDDYYNRSIEEWENEMVRQRVTSQKITWGMHMFPWLLVTGISLAGRVEIFQKSSR